MKTWTVGHSSHGFDVFVALLAAHGIALLADIRTVRSRPIIRTSMPTRWREACRTAGWRTCTCSAWRWRPAPRTRRTVPGGMSRFLDTPTTRWATSSSRGCLGDFD